MAIYTKTENYSIEPSTCGAVVKTLENCHGDPACMTGFYWIESKDDDPMDFVNSWAWLQEQRKNKKIYILSHLDTVRMVEGI